MGPKINPKCTTNRGCVADAFLERFGAAWWALFGVPRDDFGINFGIIFDQNSKKWDPKRHPKIDAEKVSKMMPKGSQNDAK